MFLVKPNSIITRKRTRLLYYILIAYTITFCPTALWSQIVYHIHNEEISRTGFSYNLTKITSSTKQLKRSDYLWYQLHSNNLKDNAADLYEQMLKEIDLHNIGSFTLSHWGNSPFLVPDIDSEHFLDEYDQGVMKNTYKTALPFLRRIALCSICDWKTPEQLFLSETYEETVSNSPQKYLTYLCEILSWKVYFSIKDNDFHTAAESLRFQIMIADHLSKSRTTHRINAKPAYSIENKILNAMFFWASIPNSPNLRFEIEQLPGVLINYRPAFESHVSIVKSFFSVLSPIAKEESLIDKDWNRIWSENLFHTKQLFDERNVRTNNTARMIAIATNKIFSVQEYVKLLKELDRFKAELVIEGFDRSELEKLPKGRVLALYSRMLFDKYYRIKVLQFQSLLALRTNNSSLKNGEFFDEHFGIQESLSEEQLKFPIIETFEKLIAADDLANYQAVYSAKLEMIRLVETIRYVKGQEKADEIFNQWLKKIPGNDNKYEATTFINSISNSPFVIEIKDNQYTIELLDFRCVLKF